MNEYNKDGKTARLRAIAEQVLGRMQTNGWNPIRLNGHSKRYRVTIPGQGTVTVASKMSGPRYKGWMGWAQQMDGKWSTPLIDTDFILYATPYKSGLGVWMFPTKAVRERLERVQRIYDEREWGRKASLWINIFEQTDRPNLPPCQVNFAEGGPPMWEIETSAAKTGGEPTEASGEVEHGLRPLTIPDARAGLSLGLGVPESAIEITVRF